MSQSITTTLGLNLPSFVLYTLAFLVTVGILTKYAWPPLTRILDEKVDELERASQLEREAKQRLEHASAEAMRLVKSAREESEGILQTAKENSNLMISEAEEKARTETQRQLAAAETQIEQAWRKAESELKQETARLVIMATERLIDAKLDAKADMRVIEQALSARGRS